MSRIIKIEDDSCYMCSRLFNDRCQRTTHHCLPKNLKPDRNILVPICVDCHNKLNSQDVASLTSYGYRLKKDTIELMKRVGIMNGFLEKINMNNNKKGKEK